VAETVLVKDPLTPEMMAIGKSFLQALDKAGFVARAALWFFRHRRRRLEALGSYSRLCCYRAGRTLQEGDKSA
jgi:hypothetical protein